MKGSIQTNQVWNVVFVFTENGFVVVDVVVDVFVVVDDDL